MRLGDKVLAQRQPIFLFESNALEKQQLAWKSAIYK